MDGTVKNIDLIIDMISKSMHLGCLSNSDLVKIIEHTGDYLNLQTISDYSRENNMSYNGVKKCREVQLIFNTKYVIDND